MRYYRGNEWEESRVVQWYLAEIEGCTWGLGYIRVEGTIEGIERIKGRIEGRNYIRGGISIKGRISIGGRVNIERRLDIERRSVRRRIKGRK